MTKKINVFTVLIFAYSFVVCATFKKEGNQTPSFASNKNTITVKQLAKVKTTIKTETLLALEK